MGWCPAHHTNICLEFPPVFYILQIFTQSLWVGSQPAHHTNICLDPMDPCVANHTCIIRHPGPIQFPQNIVLISPQIFDIPAIPEYYLPKNISSLRLLIFF